MSEPIRIEVRMPLVTVGDYARWWSIFDWLDGSKGAAELISYEFSEGSRACSSVAMCVEFEDKGLAALFKLTWG